jgi:tRNA-2-methylthio-N6-dimethylallyladenosine synthase
MAARLEARGMERAESIGQAQHIVINTCMIRETAEHRVYGMVNNLGQRKLRGEDIKIVVTGCMVGMAVRDKTGRFLQTIKKRLPYADEFLPIEEVGFDSEPVRTNAIHAWVPVSNGCNNFCTFCVVPFTRGREVSRPIGDIITECRKLVKEGFTQITLIGQNVNSYGADLILGEENVHVLRDLKVGTFFQRKERDPAKKEKKITSYKGYKLPNGVFIDPVWVRHLGRMRIPTLFPFLLEEICRIDGIEVIDFISSNPWDFSDELIATIAGNKKISRRLHMAIQSGDNMVLKRMNRWYTREDLLKLFDRIRAKVPDVLLSTDIIVGFCQETDKQFQNTVNLCRKIGFYKAYVSMYSDRPFTAAHKAYKDNVPHAIKKKRWEILENLINKPNLDFRHPAVETPAFFH